MVRRVEALGKFLDSDDGKNLLAGTKQGDLNEVEGIAPPPQHCRYPESKKRCIPPVPTGSFHQSPSRASIAMRRVRP